MKLLDPPNQCNLDPVFHYYLNFTINGDFLLNNTLEENIVETFQAADIIKLTRSVLRDDTENFLKACKFRKPKQVFKRMKELIS